MYDPEERLKLLGTQSESVDIDPTRPIIRFDLAIFLLAFLLIQSLSAPKRLFVFV